MASVLGRVLIYGGRGALGAACVAHFKSHNWWVGSIDLVANDQADANILVKNQEGWVEQEANVCEMVGELLKGEKVDAVICVAGGWAGGNAASEELVKTADLMWRQSVWSAAIAASIAVKNLKEGGLVTLPGAKPALGPTPGMIGYGMAKAAVHQLTKSLAAEKSGLPPNCLTVAILPVTLDTPMNRKWMPSADFSTWTPLEFVAELLLKNDLVLSRHMLWMNVSRVLHRVRSSMADVSKVNSSFILSALRMKDELTFETSAMEDPESERHSSTDFSFVGVGEKIGLPMEV